MNIRLPRRARWLAFAFALLATSAHATFHIVQIDQIFSDSTGNVQYVRLAPLAGGQGSWNGHGIVASSGATQHSFAFGANLPGDTTNKEVLVATQGFAALNIVTPDFIVPNGFLFMPGGTINYAESADTVTYATLPTDGSHAIDRAGNVVIATPQNFAGQSGTVNLAPPTQAGPMDIDLNGKVDALTDGLLLLRYAFGLRGAALINGAIGPGAVRNTAAQIEAYLAQCLGATGFSC